MSKKSVYDWFAEYGQSHRHPVNEWIHWICVPAIALSLLGLMWSIPMPRGLRDASPLCNFATLFVVLASAFYLRLSIPLAIGMLLFSAASLGVIWWFEKAGFSSVWLASLVLFVVAWIFQFVGHKLEGKKPAFLQDVQFLLIGPIWVLAHFYRRWGIRY